MKPAGKLQWKPSTNPFYTLFFFCLLLCILHPNPARTQARVQGVVKGQNNQPLPAATILLLRTKDSALVKGSITQQGGQFQFDNVAPGSYLVAASFSGLKETYSQPIEVAQKDATVRTDLNLTEKEATLEAVVVTAKKPLFEQKIDRMVINVASSIVNTGTTALDVLIRSPGIIVDQQNNNLSMNGKDGVVVMLNGKISRMPISAVIQLLASINSANIERIELITTPPANYDAEGNAGFINIVLKENQQFGTNGNYALTAGMGKKPQAGASMNFNHRQGKFNLFGDYSFNTENLITYFIFNRTVVQDNRKVETNAINDRWSNRLNHNARLGLDVELSKKTTIGVLGTYLHNTFSMDALNRSHILADGILDTLVTIDNKENHPLSSHSANFNLTQQFNEKHKLVFNTDYINYHDANTVDYLNRYEKGNGDLLWEQPLRSNKTTPIRFWVNSADHTWTISKKATLESGIKSTFSRFTNDVRVEWGEPSGWKPDPDLTNISYLRERIKAAYSSLSLQLSEKTSIKAGLRYEHTVSNLSSDKVKNIIDRKYGNLFPTLFLSQVLAEKQSINLAYSRRITRPTFNDMAPFVYFVDPNTLFSGNPALQPAFSDAIKLDYLFRQLIFSFSYTYEKNAITNFAPRVDAATNKLTFFAENQPDRKAFSFNISMPWQPKPWWNIQTNFSANRNVLNAIYLGDALKVQQQNLQLVMAHTFTLPKDFSAELRGYYLTGFLFSVYRVPAFGSLDIGVQKKFAAKRSSLRFAVSDVFGPPVFKPSVNQPDKNLVASGRLLFGNTIARLTFTRNFGNDKVKAQRSRNSGSEDERSRVTTN
ncbi:Outer membrane receptor proteins, mostly Fe transport [Cnuella takakiae]|uniref:Outer membrane receptor proteins, mostly Fe transport n=1 Tax=Cnuella takakiae TaxID=1302690 RepID=A0A1M4T0Q4_9BACT|nr:TonB-dependent receptor [Cnuella takakiae]SHE38062.1 Outer membrane receptor proteins, mostly Fe transport [Cnuella takakiae]